MNIWTSALVFENPSRIQTSARSISSPPRQEPGDFSKAPASRLRTVEKVSAGEQK
jgi:hypothetical protein